MVDDRRSSADTVPLSTRSSIYPDQVDPILDLLAQRLSQASSLPDSEELINSLGIYRQRLAAVHRTFRQSTLEELALTYASEWVLDNYYLLRQAIRQVEEDLPAGYYHELPKVNEGSGLVPRIYLLARTYLEQDRLQFDLNGLAMLIDHFQDRLLLKMGELWAVPIFLRYALIEVLVHALERILRSNEPALPTPDLETGLADDEIVAACVSSLRIISNQDWKTFFESVSRVDRTLGRDPAGVYTQMDFDTRDLYRKAVEKTAHLTGQPEQTVASVALDLANAGQSDQQANQRRNHVGCYLIAEGVPELEKELGYRPSLWRHWLVQARANPAFLYLASIFLLPVLVFVFLGSYAYRQALDPLQWIVIPLLLLVPTLTISVSLVNYLATAVIPPSRLPKLQFKKELPEWAHTLVVIPSLLTDREEVESLARQLELHYLRNPQTGLYFGLLSDFGDADSETMPTDEALLQQAEAAVRVLNQRYAQSDTDGPFVFLHRKRVWNASENVWMGWERKRGKLHELNALLRDRPNLTFLRTTGNTGILTAIRYVITLDADTILPSGSAARLTGAIAHPLNRALFAGDSGEVAHGYTILQPRVEIGPASAGTSWFTRIFAGDTGLDLYTLAVSDVYQDLFGEGIYVGKGIYDVDAFERSLANTVPENTLLSHDLFEGLQGRVGLVSDITLVEDYPPHYFIHMARTHRWIRGDWQLLPWLLNPSRMEHPFSAIDTWKILDNLRRSLVAPAVLLLFALGWLILPGSALMWTAAAVLSLAAPIFTGLAQSLLESIKTGLNRSTFQTLLTAVLRWLLAVVFLPVEAILALDAILITLYRVLISRRRLLQWTTAAQTITLFDKNHNQNLDWRYLAPAVLLTLALAVTVGLVRPAALPAALPVLAAWAVSPWIAHILSLPIIKKQKPLSEDEEQMLHVVARRTWSFFEQFVGPEDHWLPPDHFQENPLGLVAHRTSPTNIGLLLTSTLAAYDLGYIDQFSLAARLAATFDTLESLERYRGHFLNWYDTLSLQTLNPRYVSTVDSGNLAACLIIVAQTCHEMPTIRIFRWERWEGYIDMLLLLDDTFAKIEDPATAGIVMQLHQRLNAMKREIQDAKDRSERWYDLYRHATGPFWKEISSLLQQLVSEGRATLHPLTLRMLLQVSSQLERHHTGVARTLADLVPWISLLSQPPLLVQTDPALAAIAGRFRRELSYSPTLKQIQGAPAALGHLIKEFRQVLTQVRAPRVEKDHAAAWAKELEEKISNAAGNANVLMSAYQRMARQAERMVQEMDFRFLYDPQRRVFHLGYNMEANLLDRNYYDLLASESRITSILSIAKGDVPNEHWLHLARPITRVGNQSVLLSWSATMFEYVMPDLFLRTYEGTLLWESAYGAVQAHIDYGRSTKGPWGISESGFYRFDASQSYQYRAFGVPGLGFKRGLADDRVIAPYASIMAVRYNPKAVVQNIIDLTRLKMLGLYGFYEAVDFTPERLSLGQTHAQIREYMSHHQGMMLMALVNYFKNDIMIQRMHADARIHSVELLLQEQIPGADALQSPESEDVKGLDRMRESMQDIPPWQVPVKTSIPQVHLLSNGRFKTVISNSGSGYSEWKDSGLTRWQPDPVLDPWGLWVYIQDLDTYPLEDGLWSAGSQPISANAVDVSVTDYPHMAVFQRVHQEITSTMEVTVPPDDDIEVRRIHLRNHSGRLRRLRLTSYAEVILTAQQNDSRHPAFNKLFVESEYMPNLNLLIFRRRPRSSSESPLFMAHMLVLRENRTITRSYETDRALFIGRHGSLNAPAALFSPQYLSRTVGATLDPILSIGQEVILRPHENAQVAYLTFAAATREEIIHLAQQHQPWEAIERAFHQADIAVQAQLRKQEIDDEMLSNIEKIYSGLLYPLKENRAAAEIINANRRGQSALWPYGISGDYPILLVRINDPQKLDLVREALQVHRYWRERGILVDLVILNEQETNYGAELNNVLYRLIHRTASDNWMNQRGGVYVLYVDQMRPDESILLQTAASLVLDGNRGPLNQQVTDYAVQVPHLPAFTPAQTFTDNQLELDIALPDPGPRSFWNGYGGFSEDGGEYIIDLPPGVTTPAPWANVIGYPDFGFLVTESGASCTWAGNSGENRLTPWFNDPLCDPTGEALYLRDEETGQVWTPTPLPASDGKPYRIRHGMGYSIFEHNSQGINQQLKLFCSPDHPVKIILLRLENTGSIPRRITATQYAEWVLGTSRTVTQPFIVSHYEIDQEALLAANPYNAEFGERVAFLAAGKKVHDYTADRTEFLGRGGSMRFPIALTRIGLERRAAPGENPCAALQVHIDLAGNGVEEIYFILGQGSSREEALDWVRKYQQREAVDAAWQATGAAWQHLLQSIQVHTPDPAMNLMLNRWLLYQAISCRLWGRTAFYQSSGAYGFRDQLQDVLALLPHAPEIARRQILEAARHQFEEGDVLHWWHPPSGRGVRTHFADDLLWLPYGVSEYVRVTGDWGILDEQIPFLKAAPLKPGEEERYGEYPVSTGEFSLLEHCRRAIEKGSTAGRHGIPLMKSGDWNDGMNRVGMEGHGESIWMGWFLGDVLQRFASLLEDRSASDSASLDLAAEYRQRAAAYAGAIQDSAWDGDWYLRAFYDNNDPLGSKTNRECQIDSIAQSWALISGLGQEERDRHAMQSVLNRLVRPEDRLILLFTPPFNHTPNDPGYIKGYVPGIRENGGQYTHAAIWAAWAFTKLGDGSQAGELFKLLNPIYQADQRSKSDEYRVEPYVVAADIYSTPPHVRRGGWTWYTGSAGWLYRLGLEAILGFNRRGDTLVIDPVIPAEWDEYEMTYRCNGVQMHIRVENPGHVECGVKSISLDGRSLPTGEAIPLPNDGALHEVIITLGP